MLYSMTGFGKIDNHFQNTDLQIEIRSLNSKGLDVNLRIPHYLRAFELEIRNVITQKLKRGKVDAFFRLQLPDNLQASTINAGVFRYYWQQLNQIKDQLGIDKPVSMESILALPNILENQEEEVDESHWNNLKKTLEQACDQVNQFREQEGAKTESLLLDCISSIENDLQQIPNYEEERTSVIRTRIRGHFDQFKNSIDFDENRLEQEMIYYIEKFDISEEKTRLTIHLHHFKDLLADKSTMAKGKKLNFVSQEIGREINTIGSKANHAEIQKFVVDMKDQLEQIKEQLSNIL